MRGVRAASFLFCFSGVPSHGPGSTMVGAMAERHQDIEQSRSAMALPSIA